MKVIAFITEHMVVDKILRYLTRRDEEGRGWDRPAGPSSPGITVTVSVFSSRFRRKG